MFSENGMAQDRESRMESVFCHFTGIVLSLKRTVQLRLYRLSAFLAEGEGRGAKGEGARERLADSGFEGRKM